MSSDRVHYDETWFWSVIDTTRSPSGSDAHLVALAARLTADATKAQLDEFQAILEGYHDALDRKDLWAAASTFMGGCGDDAFIDFRYWLILHGRDAIEQFVNDPDVLATWRRAR